MSLLSSDEKVQHLVERWTEGTLDIQAVEKLLIEVIETDAWKKFHTPNGIPVEPRTFRDFIIGKPFSGLGSTEEKIAGLLGDNNDAVVKMRKLLKGQGKRTDLGNNVTEVPGRKTITGNRRDYTLDRLTRERPDLRARVDSKELSANAAAIEAGFRKRTFSAPVDDADSIATALRRHVKPDVLRQLVAQLQADQ
jgi:hypothetical protein